MHHTHTQIHTNAYTHETSKRPEHTSHRRHRTLKSWPHTYMYLHKRDCEELTRP